MADMCKAKLRVPRQLVPLRQDGAFQAGNAPYARSALLSCGQGAAASIWLAQPRLSSNREISHERKIKRAA
jgi:hypothetical protein